MWDPRVKPEPLPSSNSSSCYSYDGFGLPELEPSEPMTPGTSNDVAATPRRDGGEAAVGVARGKHFRGVRLRPWGKFVAEVAGRRAGEGRKPPAEGPMGREEGERGGNRGRQVGGGGGKEKRCESDTWVPHA
jgi:hypothetical protein